MLSFHSLLLLQALHASTALRRVSGHDGGLNKHVDDEMDQNIQYNRSLHSHAFHDLIYHLPSRYAQPNGLLQTIIPIRDFVHPANSEEAWEEFLIMSVLYFAITIITGILYKCTKKTPTPPANIEGRALEAFDKPQWQFELCGCFDGKCGTCCITFICPQIRWSDTMEMAGFMSYWKSLTILAVLLFLSDLTYGVTGILLLVMATYRRRQIKVLFGIPAGDVMVDCCTVCWCCPCATLQEARQLEEAYIVGHPVVTNVPDAESSPWAFTQGESPEQRRAAAAGTSTAQ